MLKLHRLEISGFKSFVDPVSTDFADGITAIVGPNGCGKSNLSEAVTWALGEQSTKFLRSGKMEDVIFSGSQRRRPLGMAEVTLTLRTDPGFEHAEDGMIRIGRRVFRGGESQYRLNDRVVPLKRIRDLLMDTGLGIRAYSVIGQGQVESVLSGKPQERRQLLEEAAGITRYKARKRVAELKLEDAAGSLQRLEDVVGELERSLRSLKRQAGAARRFQEREVEHRELLSALLTGKWRQVSTELGTLRETLAQATTGDAELSATLHGEEAELAAGRAANDRMAEEVSERHTRQTTLAATIEGRQELIKGGQQTIREIEDRLERGLASTELLSTELEAQRGALDSLTSRHTTLNSEHEEARTAIAADREQIEQASEIVKAAEARLETLRTQLLAAGSKVTALQARLHQEQIEAEKGSYRQEHTNAALDRLNERWKLAEKALADASNHVASIDDGLQEKTSEHEGAAKSLADTLRLEAEVGDRIQTCKDESTALEQRCEILKGLEAEDAGRRARIEELWQSAGIGQPRFLADELTVPNGWEDSIDLFLEPLRDSVLIPASEDPYAIARTVAAEGAAGALLHAVEPGSAPPSTIEDPAIVEALPAALGLPLEYHAGLPEAYLVETAEDAESLARRMPSASFLSREGTCTQGRLLRIQGETANPGVLARKRDLQQISVRIPEIRVQRESLSGQLDTLVGKRSREAEAKNRIEAEQTELSQQLAVARARLQESGERAQDLEQSHRDLQLEKSTISEELGRVDEQRDALRRQLDEEETSSASLGAQFDAAQTELDEARERRELVSTAGAGRQGRLDLLQERLGAHLQERDRLEQRCLEIERQGEEWRSEEARLEERGQALAESIDQAREELQAALKERDVVEQDSRETQEQLTAKREEIKELEARLEELRSRQEGGRERIQELRVSEASLLQDQSHLEASYEEAFPGAEVDSTPIEDDEEPVEIDDLEQRLEHCRGVLDRLGPVNLLATKEFDEQEERHTFLVEQREDVQSSIDRLRATIREINQTSSERFLATFNEVNRHFAEVFTTLFSGGEAQMRLLDEDDPLESGIEIVARPPGKRLQNLMLLSGGEKALTAIALLFGLFRAKPSPFCILDEVDAALDDSNILRFVELLRASAKDIQFLIISHNKLTMEAASTLYGITMEEKGVSKIVGVELDDMHPQQALATA